MWRAPIVGMWVQPHADTGQATSNDNATAVAGSVAVQMALPAAVRSQYGYGAPTTVWLLVTEPPTDRSTTAGTVAGMLDLEVELVWGGKAATRLYEGIYFEVHPALQQPAQTAAAAGSNQPAAEDGEEEEGWRLLVDKIGRQVDTADVVTHGGSAVHGIDPNGGVTFAAPGSTTTADRSTTDGHGFTAAGGLSLHVDSLDAGLIMPGAAGNVWNFTAFFTPPAVENTVNVHVGIAPDPADGLSFNLMNNQYWTNYVLWYPWLAEDSVGRFRFRLCEMVVENDGAMQSCAGNAIDHVNVV